MESDECVFCGKTVRPRQEAIACDTCQRWQHRTCATNVTREEYRRMVRGNLDLQFNCVRCTDADPPVAHQPDVADHPVDYDPPVGHQPDVADHIVDADPPVAHQPDVADHPVDDDPPVAHQPDVADHIVDDDPPVAHQPDVADHPVDDDPPVDQSFDVDASFIRRRPQLEQSIVLEREIDAVAEDDQPTTYEEIPGASQRGKPVLVDSRGYSYTLWRTNGDRRTWRCKKRSKTLACPATVIQKGEHYTEGRKDHIHVSEPGIATKLIIETEVKAMASKDMFTTSAPRIVEEMVREHTDADMPSTSRPKPTNLVRAVNRKRQQLRPKDPVDIDFVLHHDYLEDNAPGFFLRDLDVRHTNNRHLIFMTDRQHQLMRDAD